MKTLLKPFKEKLDDQWDVYRSSGLKSLVGYKIEELDGKDFIVLFKKDDALINYAFLECDASNTQEDFYSLLWHGYGFSDNLRELRHSYIGENGYVFYLNKKNFELALNWLSQYFDMD